MKEKRRASDREKVEKSEKTHDSEIKCQLESPSMIIELLFLTHKCPS